MLGAGGTGANGRSNHKTIEIGVSGDEISVWPTTTLLYCSPGFERYIRSRLDSMGVKRWSKNVSIFRNRKETLRSRRHLFSTRAM